MSAEAAERKAADMLRAGEELLPGTGDQIWKGLFEAARRYFTEAYPGEAFPPASEAVACPLCQNPLGETGKQRLSRFNEFVKNDVARTAEAARKKLGSVQCKIETADLKIIAEEALRDELNSLDEAACQKVTEFQDCINSRRDAMIKCLKSNDWTGIPAIIESPELRIRSLAARQLRAYRTLVKAADEEKRKTLDEERNELRSRQGLARSLEPILSLLDRMKKKASLEKCRASLGTRSISAKSKELASAAVTDELKKALDREFKALGMDHVRTKLKERSSRGKMLHRLLLDLPASHKIDEILSEGEQRSIALGAFFAELSLANHSCGIVFDDPVSSLDHWRRRHVARRLVQEAKNRQVIVFTHDTSFLGQLRDEIELEGIPCSMSFLEWRSGAPGWVADGLPWDHQGYKARIDSLEQVQSKLAKAWPAYPDEETTAEIRQEYSRLRATVERVIQDVVFNGVVKRYRDWINVKCLGGVVGFDAAEHKAIERLHKRCCDVVTAHDPSSDKAVAVPSPTELGEDIAALKDIVDTTNARKAAVKKTL